MAGKEKEFVLLQGVVIPKGTVFKSAPAVTKRNEDHFDTVIGLTKNTAGVLDYCINEDEELAD